MLGTRVAATALGSADAIERQPAVTGVENRVITIVSAGASTGHADMRGKSDIGGIWRPDRRNGFDRIRYASMPTACGVMTVWSSRKR